MILRIELHYRQGYLDVSVDRTDDRIWWRQARPWARLTLPIDALPESATQGLIAGVVALSEALQLPACSCDACTPCNSGS